jgi:hypothetical protein
VLQGRLAKLQFPLYGAEANNLEVLSLELRTNEARNVCDPFRKRRVLDRLPLNYDDTTIRTIEQIDVL